MQRPLAPDSLLAPLRHRGAATNQRRNFLGRALFRPVSTVLEFGALHEPTIEGDECLVHFTDWCDTETLRGTHESNPNVDHTRIVPVDFPTTDTESLPALTDTRYDLVIANHVIEHVPNIISWLRTADALTTDGGRMLLSVPDRRYTFDHYRDCTDVVEIVRAYEEGVKRPTRYQVARPQFYMQANLRANTTWGQQIPREVKPRLSLARALELGRGAESSGEYVDSHCWVFTCRRFASIIKCLNAAHLIRWTIEVIEPVASGQNEFRVLLRKTAPDMPVAPESLAAPYLDEEPVSESISEASESLSKALARTHQLAAELERERETVTALEQKMAIREARIGRRIDRAIGHVKRALRRVSQRK